MEEERNIIVIESLL